MTDSTLPAELAARIEALTPGILAIFDSLPEHVRRHIVSEASRPFLDLLWFIGRISIHDFVGGRHRRPCPISA